MIPPIDIFRLVDGAVVWQEPAPSVDDARLRVERLGEAAWGVRDF
jgi:hypothetical protein